LTAAILFVEEITTAAKGLWILRDANLLYICVSEAFASDFKFGDDHRDVCLGLAEDNAFVAVYRGGPEIHRRGGVIQPKDKPQLRRLYLAFALQDVVGGMSIDDASRKWCCQATAMRDVHQCCLQRCGHMEPMCGVMGYVYMSVIMNVFRKCVAFCARTDVTEFLILPSCTRVTAAALIGAGFSTCEELALASEACIDQVLSSDARRKNPTKRLTLARNLITEATDYVASRKVVSTMKELAVMRD
jgi:hypothetical protein